MKNIRKTIAVIALILVLVGINLSIIKKEKHIAFGEIAYLQLRPVDPRSLMQGDYMALRFSMADRIKENLPKNTEGKTWRERRKVKGQDGHVIVTLDEKRIATFKAIYKEDSEHTELAKNELKMQYRIRNGRVKFATDAYFFQEGTAKTFEQAKFGQFRVNREGGLLLTDMYDEKLNKLVSSKTQ